MGKKISCTLYMLTDNKSDVQSGYKIIIIQVIKNSNQEIYLMIITAIISFR